MKPVRRAPRNATAGDRISLSLPPEPASVSLARTAAIGLLQHRAGGGALGARLASAVADLVGAALTRARPRDRLRVHFDVGPDSVVATVELRRPGRWQPGGSFLESRSLAFDPDGSRSQHRRGRRASPN
ncbi:MAG: hypothetical protein OXE75_08760 [bacterium]|nr:hypothetical protein [bacterium]